MIQYASTVPLVIRRTSAEIQTLRFQSLLQLSSFRFILHLRKRFESRIKHIRGKCEITVLLVMFREFFLAKTQTSLQVTHSLSDYLSFDILFMYIHSLSHSIVNYRRVLQHL